MKRVLSCATAIAMLWLSLAGAQTAGSIQKKKAAVPPAHKSTTPSRPAAATSKSATGRKGAATKKAAPKRPAVTWRNRQMSPSTDRYKEIQNALVARGFLNAEDATGNWNQTSIEGLKRFQSQQNLDPSGKIDSLSLIALGLGPKRDPVVVPPKPQNNLSGQ